MKFAIIGTGNVGQALGKSLVRAGHEVTYAARDAAKTRRTAQTIGASAAASPAEAVAGADVVVLAVPYTEARNVASEIAPNASGKIVVDVTNPLKPDYSGLATEGGPSGAENVASWLPGARVAKAFNTLFASVMAEPGQHGVTLDALYATDDADTKAALGQVESDLGFRPIYVGPLARARELEAIGWLNIQLQMANQGSWNTAVALVGAPAGAIVGGDAPAK